jgi:hypothetical protein
MSGLHVRQSPRVIGLLYSLMSASARIDSIESYIYADASLSPSAYVYMANTYAIMSFT